MKILVINGPNINMLGIREPDIYGKQTFSDLLSLLEKTAAEESLEITQFQSNHEGQIVDTIQALSSDSVPLLGCVLNHTLAGTTRYGYGSKYGAGYGYGYHYGKNYGYTHSYNRYGAEDEEIPAPAVSEELPSGKDSE